MTGIEIFGVDERDNHWEHDAPRFRVYLHGSRKSSTAGWTDTYDVTGADVVQVIDWAQRQAAGVLTYAVALVYDDEAQEKLNPGCSRGLVWLVGMDANDTPWGSDDHQTPQTQKRMLARREQPVMVPPADRMPATVRDPYNHGTKDRTWDSLGS